MGMGPMTGRGAGYCGGYEAPGRANPIPGRGGGASHRNWYYATGVPGWGYGPYGGAPSREEETEFLRQQAEWLKQQLDAIGQRIEELGK